MVTPNNQNLNIHIEVTGLQEAIDASRRLSSSNFMDVVMNDGLREIGRTLVPSKGVGPMANETPQKTGKLARSTFFEIIGTSLAGFGIREQALVIKQPAQTPSEYGANFYGGFVRGGTKPHVIRARLKKVLRWESAGGVFFADHVNHPGTEPNPYHLRVLSQYRGTIQAIINRMTQRIISQFTSGRRAA
jgi:hypothetical protein